MPVGAGSLRDRIKIRRKTQTKNARGGLDVVWSTVATLSAEVKSINGREAVIGNVLQGIGTFQITIRYRSDLKPADQIVWLTGGNRELNLLAADDREGRRRWTTITADTQAPQGAGA